MFSKQCIVFIAILTLTKICASAEISSFEALINMRIVCYYGSWSAYNEGIGKCTPDDIDPQLCTHLMYAFGGITKDMVFKPFDEYLDIELGGYANFTRLKNYNKYLKTLLALGGWKEGGVRFASIAADSAKRRIFTTNSIAYLRKHNFDGLNLDWQYPYLKDRHNYLALIQILKYLKKMGANEVQTISSILDAKFRMMKGLADYISKIHYCPRTPCLAELREEYERESNATGRPRLLLTITLPTLQDHISRGYDIPNLNKYVDWMNVITYDYHSTREPLTNHHSKLYSVDDNFDYELNANYTINTYIASGADRDKLVLGIPTFGRSFTLSDSTMMTTGSPADGPGLPGNRTNEKGYLAYHEICNKIENEGWIVNQPHPNAMGSYAYKGNQWVGYDDENIVKKKSLYAFENRLSGIYFWVLDHDDCSGYCNGKRFPLIRASKEVFGNLYLTELNRIATVAPPSKDKSEFTMMKSSRNPEDMSVSTINSQKFYVKSRSRSKAPTKSPLQLQLTTPTPPQPPSHYDMSSIAKINEDIQIDVLNVIGKDYVKYFGDDKTLNQFQDFIKGPGGIQSLRKFLNTEEISQHGILINTSVNNNKPIKPTQKEKSDADLQDGVTKQFDKEEFKKSGTLNVVVNINL